MRVTVRIDQIGGQEIKVYDMGMQLYFNYFFI